MPLSRLYDHKVLDGIFGGQAIALPATLYIGLSTTTPAKDGTGVTEPAGSGYARVAVTNSLANWPVAVASAKSNGIEIQFPEPTASWGTPTYFVIYDAAAAGNLIAFGAITVPKLLVTGSTVKVAVGTLAESMA